MTREPTNHQKNRGLILGQILFSLAVLAIVVSSISAMTRNSADRERVSNLTDTITREAEIIRAKLLSCVISYPAGDNGTGFHPEYPARPASGLVADLACPGAPSASGDIWPGQDGISIPPVANGLSSWSYENDATSIRISISSIPGDTPAKAAINTAAKRFGSDASITANMVTFTLIR